MTRLFAFIPPLLLASQCLMAEVDPSPTPLDSIGTERRDGRRYVLHRVDQGQTLFAVARRYRTSVDAIRAANPELGAGTVRYDQLLRVPAGSTALPKPPPATIKDPLATKPVRPEETYKPATAPNGTHIVETGQTLYSLAARYGVSMADLRRWNAIGADGIRVGQTLIVSEKGQQTTAAGAAEKQSAPIPALRPKPIEEPATVANPKSKTAAEVARIDNKPLIAPEPPLAPGTKPRPKEKPASAATTEPASTRPATPKATESIPDNEPLAGREAAPAKVKTATGGKILSDVGFADVIEGDSPSNKFLALHRSAPVGTLVQVRNDISNQSLYVKVVGKLPDTGLNDQVLIRLSSRAFEKLSPNGQRFRAEVSYTK
jgi:LysM repeat protein